MKGGTDRVGATRDGVSIPESFRVLLRSPQDVVVIKTPSWWTPTHAISMLGLAAMLTLAVLAWVSCCGSKSRNKPISSGSSFRKRPSSG
jgi:hypothetical protein